MRLSTTKAMSGPCSRTIDKRSPTLPALTAAIEGRKPSTGCVHHSDRGSQYAAAGELHWRAATGDDDNYIYAIAL